MRVKTLLGIDYGSKRIGLAVSDGLGITAQGLDTLERTSVTEDIALLLELVKERDVEEIIVGYPLKLDGSEGQAAEEVKEFAELVRARCGVPVQLWDERMSTAQAEKVMLGADVSRKVRKKSRDRMAAQFILQRLMDAHKRNEDA